MKKLTTEFNNDNKLKNHSSRKFILALLTFLFALTVPTTFAWFTSKAEMEAGGELKFGKISTEVSINNSDFVTEGFLTLDTSLAQGDKVLNNVRVETTDDSSSCYIRVKVNYVIDSSLTDADAIAKAQNMCVGINSLERANFYSTYVGDNYKWQYIEGYYYLVSSDGSLFATTAQIPYTLFDGDNTLLCPDLYDLRMENNETLDNIRVSIVCEAVQSANLGVTTVEDLHTKLQDNSIFEKEVVGQYFVRFYANSGINVPNLVVDKGAEISLPQVVNIDVEWFEDETDVGASGSTIQVLGDMVLNAHYGINQDTFLVSFELDGATTGEAPSPLTITYSDTGSINVSIADKNIQKAGYSLVGWKIKDSTDENRITYSNNEITIPNNLLAVDTAAVIVPIWEAVTYTITFDIGSGTGITNVSMATMEDYKDETDAYKLQYTVNDVLELPSLENTDSTYSFMGWKVSNASTATESWQLADVIKASTPASGLYGDVVVKPLWGIEQIIKYQSTEIKKTYGDEDFINPITCIGASNVVFTYSSSNLSIATVDETTGQVTIVGVAYESNGSTPLSTTITARYGTNDADAITYTLTVMPRDINNVVVSYKEEQIVTGNQIKPTVKVQDVINQTSSKRNLVIDTDYTVAYGTNKEVGTGTIVLTGKGNYTSTKILTFDIISSSSADAGGTTWLSGETSPTTDLGSLDNLYLNVKTGDVFRKTTTGWTNIGNINGTSAVSYTGFDGYIWQGKVRTTTKADVGTVDENIRENTLSITETMANYYPGDYLDLTTSQIAIMSSYFKTISKTQYSGTTISKIVVYAKEAGDLYVGTASVKDVIQAKKDGATTVTANTAKYTVTAGLNTLEINLAVDGNETLVMGGNGSVGLYYAKSIPVTDTIGGFAYINGEINNDIIETTDGYNDTLAIEIYVGSWGAGAEKAYVENLKTNLIGQINGFNVIKGGAESYGMVMAESSAGNPGYSGKTISKVGFIFANKFSDCSSGSTVTTDVTDTDAWVYAYVIKKSTFLNNQRASENYENMYKLTFANFISNVSTQNHGIVSDDTDLVTIGDNPWSYSTSIEVYDSTTDSYSAVSSIAIGSDELIAYAVGNCNFMLATNYSGATSLWYSSYNAYGDQFNYWYHENGAWTKSVQCAFPCDMYYTEGGDFDSNFAELETEEAAALENLKTTQIKNVTNGKTISLLGDSLTAYSGYSNNASYNTTISDNWDSYGVTWNGSMFGGITSVDQMWWKQAADETGMTLCVNNSSSGSMATETSTQDGGSAKSGINRCEQLHNDVTNTNPDIIAVYMGINDLLDTSISVEDFTTAYTTIITKIKAKYTTADVFVFTIPLIKLQNSSLTGFVDTERLTAFNDAIRTIGNNNDCTVVEVYPNYSWTEDNWTEYCITGINDGLGHPVAKGMDLITEAFIDAMYEKYVTNASSN